MKIAMIASILLFLSPPTPAPAPERASRVDELIRQLSGFDFTAIRDASTELFKIGLPAVPSLLKALEDSDPGIRKEAAGILGDLKIKEAITPIGKLLSDQQYWVARGAAFALRNIADPAAISPLQEALNHRDARVREAVLDALDELIAIPAIPEITRVMFNDYDQYVRWRSMQVLREIKKGAEISAISLTLKDKTASLTARRNAAFFAGAIQAESTVPILVETFNDPDPQTRWMAIEAVGKIGDKSSRKAIEEKLKDPARDVQMFAISTLGVMGEEESVPSLAAMFGSYGSAPAHPEIKKNTIRSLRRIGGAPAAAAVRPLLSDPDKWVRAAAVEALGAMKDKDSLKEIAALAGDQSPAVRSSVMFALGEIGGNSEIKTVEAGLKDANPWVKQEAERAKEKLISKK